MAETNPLQQIIRDLIKRIKDNSKEYSEMLDTLTEAGLEEADAEKLLDRLITQVEDEEENE